jgi:hypothetical protein
LLNREGAGCSATRNEQAGVVVGIDPANTQPQPRGGTASPNVLECMGWIANNMLDSGQI